jgi:benzoyl-CoA reductase/2-hydroxyglutaryl-CoA dehydratase subunit BcrC/BadD/HgdB
MEVFYTSPWVPPEWIKAHGFEPRGLWFAEDLEAQPPPGSAGVCGFAHMAMRFADRHADAAVVFSTHCDQLRRAFDAVSGPASQHRFLFNLPATWQSAAATRLFTCELERLGRFLVRLGGQAPSAEALAETMNHYGSARRRLAEAAPHVPARAYAEALARFHWNGSVSLPPALWSNDRSVPVALVGSPLLRAHWRVMDMIEGAGGRVVLNATEAGERSLFYEAAVEQAPATKTGLAPLRALHKATLEELARLCLDKCADVFQRPNTRLYDWLRARLAPRHVRGILLWHYVGCDLWRTEAQPLREAFGFPVLLLEATEAASEALRQSGRIEAFMESLRGTGT